MAAAELLDLFPPGTSIADDGVLVVGGCRLDELAERFGTPAYVVDEGALRARVVPGGKRSSRSAAEGLVSVTAGLRGGSRKCL